MLRLPSVRPADDDFASSGMLPDDGDGRNIDWRANVEVFWILVLFFLLASSLPPNVNEAHYLTKARHFWDATFCAGDLFLESGEGHLGFCLALGWLTKYLSLPACAWVGRLLAWTALAWGWQRLSFSLVPIRGASILSAGVWAALVEYGHMSGEWVLGGWEAKVFAYALVFRGLREMVIGRWDRTGIWMGAATAMHVLVGGWTWLLVAISWLAQGAASRGSIRQLLKYWSWGVALAAIGLMPALQLQFGVDGLTLQAAHQIYTWGRLSHHLMLRAFPSDFVARHVLLMIVFLLISQLHPRPAGVLRLAYVVWGAILLALLGALIDATLGAQPWGASLLRFYWFRIADVFVPMGVSLLGLAQLRQRFEVSPRPIRAFICGIGALVLAYGTHSVAHDRQQTIAPGDQQGGIWSESQMRDWRDACAWIKQNVPTKAMMLTPPDHQTFKWYAERPEVVTSKDVPQDARGLVEWWRRLTEVHRWQATADHDQAKRRLDELVTNYRVDYVLIRVYPGYVIPPRPVIYQNPSYVLLEGLAASAHVNESQANDSLSAVESSSEPFSTSSNAAAADDHQSQAVGR